MPKILEERGFRFIVWPNDHEPAHVHVKKNAGELVLNVSGSEPVPIEIRGQMPNKTVNQILDIAEENLATLKQGWEKYHGCKG
ncbi:DUF4160 domain-containing protein [Romeria aff. gracilis LEGE 07310]|uniref:DUF4160 domain-containing protein n=1 Tax=Vasconcelosia minhoensis LEGE 07310 TaxID=915328 RepID=A0A8J7AEC1_9CYAN|nr:DUF4160 domain-containing protein [Romeria aff. gracilis LEGE 07310]